MEAEKINGRIWMFGDNIDTDLIYPVTYFFWNPGGITDPEEIKKHGMAGIDENFTSKIQPGDIIVAGKNFGCGSHREQAVTSLKYAGIGLIIAKSFARTYYHNAINLGMPLLEWKTDDLGGLQEGDTLSVDLRRGLAINTTRGKELPLEPMAPLLLDIVLAGGLVEIVKKKGTHEWWKAA